MEYPHEALDKNTVIFDEGAKGTAMYVVLTGEVVLSHRGGGRNDVQKIGPGGFFGEAALLSTDNRTYTVPQNTIMHP